MNWLNDNNNNCRNNFIYAVYDKWQMLQLPDAFVFYITIYNDAIIGILLVPGH